MLGAMEIHTHIPLKDYTTMRLGGAARFMATITDPADLPPLVKRAADQGLALFVLGGGSNTIVHDKGFDGLVIHNQIPGFNVVDKTTESVTIRIGAGEVWDTVVKRAVDMGLSGIEALSAIPGTAGAAPVQNIGAYGQEVADTLVSVDAFDTDERRFVTLTAADCELSYRHSIFRGRAQGRYIITAITLRLYTAPPRPPFYAALQSYLNHQGIGIYTPAIIRQAVMAIRADKLPDPARRPNAGSFFKNAIIEQWQLDQLAASHPDLPHYDMGDGRYKVPTGWLIDQAGLRGELLHGMRVHDKNALVLINESAAGYDDLAAAREQIVTAVRDLFRIEIEQEPLEL